MGHDVQNKTAKLNAGQTKDAPLALYMHWPFCVSKCPYCDFNSHVRESVDVAAWRGALLTDLAHEREATGPRSVSSIFFGGGTPSLMPPALVEALITEADRLWGLDGDCEITLEANPNSAEAANFADLGRAGVNRVSLGLQSLDDEALAFLGRAHSVAEGLAALDSAQAAFDRVSFDLIYALPGQGDAEWRAMLERALGFGTGHLSLYQLTIEPGTRFATLARSGKLDELDEEQAARLFELTDAITREAGLPAYEVSNHALAGEESRHNLAYWRYRDYAGVGPGAHGRRGTAGRLWATERHKKPENFLNGVERNGHGLREERALDVDEQAVEALLMGLRLAEGVDVAELAERFGRSEDALVDFAAVDRLAAQGLATRDGAHIALTSAGRLLINAILAEVVTVTDAA